MIVNRTYYYGLPPSQVAALNSVAEATLVEFHRLATAIYEKLDGKKRSFGDIDYTLTPDTSDEDGTDFNRIRIVDHSASWIGVIQWGQPSFGRLPQYKGCCDLWIAARPEGSLDWDVLDTEWGLPWSNVAIFIQARKLSADAAYGQPIHTLNYKHPFLYMLKLALDELEESEAG